MKQYTHSLLHISKDYQFPYWQLWELKILSPFLPSQTSGHLQNKQMRSSYPLDWPLARFSKNFISKISFTPSEWTASVRSSSVVHWKWFLIFSYKSLSKTPGKGQLSFPWILLGVWSWSRGILYSGCQSFLIFGKQSFVLYNSQKINLKDIHTCPYGILYHSLHIVHQLQYAPKNWIWIQVTFLRIQVLNRTIPTTYFFHIQSIFPPRFYYFHTNVNLKHRINQALYESFD